MPTPTAFFDGWFRTGDEGVLEDGYLRLRGRLKEMIIRGGENISPYEIEAVLLVAPAGVGEAVVFGVDDGEVRPDVAAAVVLHGEATPDELRRHARESLAAFKVPEHDPRPGRDPEDRHRARCSARGCPRSSRAAAVRFAVLGAGAIGAYVGAGLDRGGADVDPDRARRAPAGHGGARRPRPEPTRGLRGRPAATSDIEAIADADVVVLGLKAYSLPQIAPRIGELLRPGAVVIAAQNGIPWWYFQGLRRRSRRPRGRERRPWWRRQPVDRRRAGGRLRRLLLDRDRRSRA